MHFLPCGYIMFSPEGVEKHDNLLGELQFEHRDTVRSSTLSWGTADLTSPWKIPPPGQVSQALCGFLNAERCQLWSSLGLMMRRLLGSAVGTEEHVRGEEDKVLRSFDLVPRQ